MSLEIDWASAEVHGGDVTVDLAGKVPKQCRERFEAVRSLLGESSGGSDSRANHGVHEPLAARPSSL
jgi:hypothetical protein